MDASEHEDVGPWLASVQGHFDGLVRSTLESYPMAACITTPTLTEAEVRAVDRAYLPVDGMYGGFSYWLDESGGERRLIVESWCRILNGSGLRHAITPDGATLLSMGFI